MKLLIEVPTWLGDAIMSTPAIENLLNFYKPHEVIIVGSFVSTQLFKNHPSVTDIIIDDTKSSSNRYFALYKLSQKLNDIDVAVSFRSSFTSKLLLFLSQAKKRFQFKKTKCEDHQVLKYNSFINKICQTNVEAKDLKIYSPIHKYSKPTLGINPGATYGSAKRWYPSEFSKIAIQMSKTHDIVIFGGPAETDIAADIEKELVEAKISNYENISGKTSIPILIEKIAGLDIFITNDSGPMHVAAAFKVNTYAIFGPTKFTQTNQWNNPQEHIISKKLDCAPCMKRECPLGHHDCMKQIKAEDILDLIYE